MCVYLLKTGAPVHHFFLVKLTDRRQMSRKSLFIFFLFSFNKEKYSMYLWTSFKSSQAQVHILVSTPIAFSGQPNGEQCPFYLLFRRKINGPVFCVSLCYYYITIISITINACWFMCSDWPVPLWSDWQCLWCQLLLWRGLHSGWQTCLQPVSSLFNRVRHFFLSYVVSKEGS